MRVLVVVLAMLMVQATGAEQFDLELTSGERLRGELVADAEGTIRFAHPLLGVLEIPRDVVASLDPVEAAPATLPAVFARAEDVLASPVIEAPIASAEPEPEPEPEPVLPWDQAFELGFNARAGTVEDQSTRVSYRAERVVDEDRLRYDATYRYSATGGSRTENALTTGLYASWSASDGPIDTFVEARFDHDEFQPWDYRVTSSGGITWDVIDVDEAVDGDEIDRLSLTMRGGGGVRREWGSFDDSISPEAVLGTELAWQITTRQKLSAASTFFPSMERLEEFRVVSRIDWTMAIDELDGISLKLGMMHEHQSMRDEFQGRDDYAVFASLVLAF